MPVKHNGSIQTAPTQTGDEHCGFCSCLWRGEWRRTTTMAFLDLQQHLDREFEREILDGEPRDNPPGGILNWKP